MSTAKRQPALSRITWLEPLECRRLFSSIGVSLPTPTDHAVLRIAPADVSSAAPTITAQPVDHTVKSGQTIHFTALASSSPASSVQWQISTNRGKSFANITGNSTAKTITLALPHVDASKNQTEYRAVFANSFGSTTTTAATLTIPSAGSISLTTPAHAGSTIVTGISTTLSALAALDPGKKGLTYTWSTVKSPGKSIAPELLPTFSSNGTSAARQITVTFHRNGSYRFRCTIRDSRGNLITTEVPVVVRQIAYRLLFRKLPQSVDIDTRTTYRADVYDQFRHSLERQPHIHYYLKYGDGFIDDDLGYFYSSYIPGDVAISAESGNLSDTIYISVNDPNPVDLSPGP